MVDLTPNLEPVTAFHEAGELEAQLKALTADVVREHMRAGERDLNVYGAPHLGSFDLVERWVKSDGLAMTRGDSKDAMRYLYNAWRARNPKRGLHFLRTYLQLLWPQAWEIDQLWQKKSEPYPSALYTKDQLSSLGVSDPSADYFLTSRLNVDVAADTETGDGVLQVLQSLRHVAGAKFHLGLRLLRRSHITISAACLFTPAQGIHTWGALKPFEISNFETSLSMGGVFTPSQSVNSSGVLSPLGVAANTAVQLPSFFGLANSISTSGTLQ